MLQQMYNIACILPSVLEGKMCHHKGKGKEGLGSSKEEAEASSTI